MIDLACRHQPEQRPGGLRGGTRRALVAAVVELVAGTVLAPAAVGILNTREPRDRLAQFRRAVLHPGSVERTQHRPGAVDVVHSPAPVPAAFGVLCAPQIVDRAPD